MNDMDILSAGIDIGTTTTQMVISRLSLKNRMPGSQIPKIEITDKEVIYRSRIHMTPILDHAVVDAAALRALLEAEYRLAGLDARQIDTGAVIITGETAKKENAAAIVHLMAELAGDFVVAVAGPDVESVLAGKGSGAMELSRRIHGRIINLDVGGGTTNIAVFNDGKLEDSTCVNVGGRLLEVHPGTGALRYAALPAQEAARAAGVPLDGGLSAYAALCELLVAAVDSVALHEPLPRGCEALLMSSPLDPGFLERSRRENRALYDGVLFSGGVSEYLYSCDDGVQPFIHGDIGPILASAFRRSRLIRAFPLLEPAEKIRATVIGAGSYSLEVSGSTIHIDWDRLPVRNVPVARVELCLQDFEQEAVQGLLETALGRYAGVLRTEAVGIAVTLWKYPGYGQVEALARALIGAWDAACGRTVPLIILLEQDFGKVLGQTVRRITENRGSFASIDSVTVQDGDYIDIGKPVLGGDAVPLVVKTLIFQSGGVSN